ncbi:DUF3631 domain-containing protein [Edaphobacter modestus]|uniref:Toprim domain-containing protein n=1 Tax=Edaphobacter modestus TaxID=388466 RepID=A0A4Q7Z1T0_9BACT|nr:DUF3631 domain-containing protein [Edaphobacter modestus]RZU43459.1 Toprim domain-containing protein [Edaphobacter modestus]
MAETPQQAAERLTRNIGTVVNVYPYRNMDGTPSFYNLRILQADNNKTFRMMSDGGNGFELRRHNSLRRETGWPLYGLSTLSCDGAVWVVEGERDADSLAAFGLPAVTSGGSSTDEAADWTPLAGREVVIWPDNDEAGRSYGERVARKLGTLGTSVSCIDVGSLGLGEKEDCSDWLARHRYACADDVRALIPKPLATAELLNLCRSWVLRYCVVSFAQSNVLAAWIMLTWSVGAFDLVPYLHVTAPEKQCGKSRLLEVLAAVVKTPWFTGRVTAAVLARKVDQDKPTLLLDEMDAAAGSGDEYMEAVRNILNVGYTRNGKTSICVGKGAEIGYRDLSCFGPKAFASIGKIPDTVADRSIVIAMRRKKESEKVDRFRDREVRQQSKPIAEALKRWADRDIDAMRELRPELPEELTDRQQDISEPLIVIADLAGGEWPALIRSSLLEVFGSVASEDGSTGVMLLRDIRDLFETRIGRDKDRISSVDLVESLCSLEGRPWADSNRGKGMTPNNLARKLKDFDIYPKDIRFSNVHLKGYSKDMFEDSWARYCPNHPTLNRDNATTCINIGDLCDIETGTDSSRHGLKSDENPHQSSVVTASRPETSSMSEELSEEAFEVGRI